MKTLRAPLMLLFGVLLLTGFVQRAASPPAKSAAQAGVTPKVFAAANAFLATLNDAERAKATFEFSSSQRTNWSNLPSGIFQRNGLRLGDLTSPQRQAALARRRGSAESLRLPEGHRHHERRRGAEKQGRRTHRRTTGSAAGGRGGIQFGLDEYYLAFVGAPSLTAPWILQFGGHHLAINVTIVGPNNVMTPSLPAAQPARYVLNGQTIRPLGNENDKGFALINALDAAQQKQAILSYEVTDLVLGPGNDGKVIQPEGMLASAMNANQQAMLLDVVHEWVGILNDEAATAKMAEIKANLGKTYFAWSGTTTNGGVAYYRIQGPTVVIEYAPQQGDVDHIHTIYRDPTNDYGAGLVKK